MSDSAERAYVHTLEVDGRARSCAVRLPSAYGDRPLPLVLALHGATSNPRMMEHFCGLTATGEAEGFVVGYPSGNGALANVLTWNGGRCCGYSFQMGIDDVAFFRRLIPDLVASLRIDAERVYVVGMSNGAHMAYRLAAEKVSGIAAVGAVAGPMALPADEVLADPPPPMPIIHIHGTDDEFAPYEGGRGAKSLYGVSLPSIPETLATWAKINRCSAPPRVEEFPDVAGDGTTIRKYTYTPEPGGAEVEHWRVNGGGHTWPGRPPIPTTLGKSTANLNANDVLWAFFRRQRLGARSS